MNERIKQLIAECTHTVTDYSLGIDSSYEDFDKEKFAELIVKECANAADMAYEGRCKYPGDYVGEQLGYGTEHGIAAWRAK